MFTDLVQTEERKSISRGTVVANFLHHFKKQAPTEIQNFSLDLKGGVKA